MIPTNGEPAPMPEIVCISPIDGREVCRRATTPVGEIDRALQTARAAQRQWASTSVAERAAVMQRFLAAITAAPAAGANLAAEPPQSR